MCLLKADIDMTQQDQFFSKRLEDLANRTWQRQIPSFTDFLDLNEQNIFHKMLAKGSFKGLSYRLYGGYEFAERQMLAFLPDAFSFESDEETALFPLVCLLIRPLNDRFAEKLSHRDYLGSLMNLGLERSRFGDILPAGEGAYVFCHSQTAEYVRENLSRVRHTSVACMHVSEHEFAWQPSFEKIQGSLASVRLDAMIALAFSVSRSRISSLIPEGRVFVNGRCVTSPGYSPHEEDLISVRGFGRFRYKGVEAKSRKQRLIVTLEKYT